MRMISDAWLRQAALSDDEWRQFHALFQEAELLYPEKITRKLDEAVTAVFWAKQHMIRSHQYRQRGKEREADDRMEDSFAEEDKVMKLLPSLLQEIIDFTRIDAWQ
jgi:hypothetical protein